MNLRPVKLAFYAHLALVLLGIALILLFLHFGESIFIPMIFAFLISVLLHPLANFMERRWHFPRALASVIGVLLFVAVIAGMVHFFSRQVVKFSRDIPHLQEKIVHKGQEVRQWISEKYNIEDSAQMNYLSKSANSFSGTAVSSIATTFVGVVRLVILSIFFLIFTFFILLHRRLLMRFLLALFNSQHSQRVQAVVLEIHSVIKNYVLGLLIDMLVIGILIFTALSIIGIKYALMIALLTAVLNIIPYLGIYTAMGLAMIITLANDSGAHALAVGIVFIVAHFIDANLILPRIVGGRVKLNPFITIIAVLIGNLLWGVPGMFLFIPLTAIFRIVSEQVHGLEPWAILMGEEKSETKRTGNRPGR